MIIDKINRIFDDAKNDNDQFEESYQSLKKTKATESSGLKKKVVFEDDKNKNEDLPEPSRSSTIPQPQR
jgi:hypothetical protein